MDKGIKTLQKHVEKIEKANNQILDKTFASAFNLKRTKLSDISYKKIGVFEILIHKDTNNFPVVKQKLLARIADLHIQYPFITLCFDSMREGEVPQQSQHVRALKASNDNRLILQVNWADYMRHTLKADTQPVRLPESAVKNMFQETKQKNYSILQEAINKILATAKQHTIDDKSETTIKLVENTMMHEVTRNHYTLLAQQIMKNYNGIIEIFHTGVSTVGVRVHWNIYLTQIATLDQQQRQIQLLPDFNNSINSNSSTQVHQSFQPMMPIVQQHNNSNNISKSSQDYFAPVVPPVSDEEHSGRRRRRVRYRRSEPRKVRVRRSHHSEQRSSAESSSTEEEVGVGLNTSAPQLFDGNEAKDDGVLESLPLASSFQPLYPVLQPIQPIQSIQQVQQVQQIQQAQQIQPIHYSQPIQPIQPIQPVQIQQVQQVHYGQLPPAYNTPFPAHYGIQPAADVPYPNLDNHTLLFLSPSPPQDIPGSSRQERSAVMI